MSSPVVPHPAQLRPPDPLRPPRPRPAARISWLLFRVCASVFAAAMVAQPIAIGSFLDGYWGALGVHEAIGLGLVTMTWVLVIATVLAWRPARGPVWIPLLGLALLVLVPIQLGLGYARVTSWHLPGGVLIVALSVALAVRSWRRPPEQPVRRTPDARIGPGPVGWRR